MGDLACEQLGGARPLGLLGFVVAFRHCLSVTVQALPLGDALVVSVTVGRLGRVELRFGLCRQPLSGCR